MKMNASNTPKQGQSHMFKKILRSVSLLMLVATLCVMSIAPAMAESWTSCMEGKIEHKFGSQAAACVKGFSSDDLGKIADCIEDIAGDASASILVDLGVWSVDCL